MLHHLSFGVTDLTRSAAFYDATLSALGYVRAWTDKTAVGYGYPDGDDKLAIKLRPTEVVVPGPVEGIAEVDRVLRLERLVCQVAERNEEEERQEGDPRRQQQIRG